MSLKDWIFSGMIIETRNGIKYIVVGDIFYGLTEFIPIDECYNDDLINNSFYEFDIMKIYNPKSGSLNDILKENEDLDLRWKR